MTAPYITRTTQLTVLPQDQEVFSELATHISIDDESAGEFVRVKQDGRTDNSIAINPDEWPAVREAIDRMVNECRNEITP